MKNESTTLTKEDIRRGNQVLLSFFYIFVIILMGYFLKQYINYNYTKDFSIKKEAFLKSTELECNVRFSAKKYLVSQSNGWSVYKEYFKKDDLLLDINNCLLEGK